MRNPRSMALRSAVVLLASFLAMGVLAPRPARAASPAAGIPVTGTLDGGSFAGTLDVLRFDGSGSALQAGGSLSGTLTDATGHVLGSVTDVPVTLPVAFPEALGSCDVLHLDLAPLDLDLLGLVVHLDRVVLDISAQSGPGDLLGNLLCALTGILDVNGPLTVIAQILNAILQILSGL